MKAGKTALAAAETVQATLVPVVTLASRPLASIDTKKLSTALARAGHAGATACDLAPAKETLGRAIAVQDANREASAQRTHVGAKGAQVERVDPCFVIIGGSMERTVGRRRSSAGEYGAARSSRASRRHRRKR